MVLYMHEQENAKTRKGCSINKVRWNSGSPSSPEPVNKMSGVSIMYQEAFARIKARTNEIKIGETYFLSSFYALDGAMVKVISTSTEVNNAGWPSTVKYEVIKPIGDCARRRHYAKGKIRTCSATNLYENRDAAKFKRR